MSCDADIVCLQEVEMGQFDEFFRPELYKAGYGGVFQAK
jgi:mRNA deadenylase 3'-5' endonuclease subunit Ccr4